MRAFHHYSEKPFPKLHNVGVKATFVQLVSCSSLLPYYFKALTLRSLVPHEANAIFQFVPVKMVKTRALALGDASRICQKNERTVGSYFQEKIMLLPKGRVAEKQ